MKNKKVLFFFLIYITIGCNIPHSVTNSLSGCYDMKLNNIDSLIKNYGYYYGFFSDERGGFSLMLYKDGVCVINMAIHSNKIGYKILKELNAYGHTIKRYYPDSIKNGKDLYKKQPTPTWGLYKINKDIITTELISYSTLSHSGIIKMQFQIINDSTLKRINSKYADLEYLRFIPLINKPDSLCWLKEKRWFWCDKQKYKEYKKWLREQKQNKK